MAMSKNFIGALFVSTLILGASRVLAGEIADKVIAIKANTAYCKKQCEGKGMAADIDSCMEKCSLTEQSAYAALGTSSCLKGCDKLKNDPSSFKSCEEKCTEKYKARVWQIIQGQNL